MDTLRELEEAIWAVTNPECEEWCIGIRTKLFLALDKVRRERAQITVIKEAQDDIRICESKYDESGKERKFA